MTNHPDQHPNASYIREQFNKLRDELEYWKQQATTGGPLSIAGLDILTLRLGADQTIRMVSKSFAKYVNSKPQDLVDRNISVLKRLVDPELYRRIVDAGTEPKTDRIHDTTKNTILEVRTTPNQGMLDVVIQDVTSEAVFRNYAKRYLPAELESLDEEDLWTFRYPEKRYMTVSFTNLRSFNALTEQLSPEELRTTLNNYLDEAVTCIERNHGTLDKIMGDEVMAFYGAPRYLADHALRAIVTACDQMEALKKLRETFQELGKYLPEAAIGIHTGDMVVGNVGSSSRQNYTVLGASVHLARRLCHLAAGGQILITQHTLLEAVQILPDHWDFVEDTWETSASVDFRPRRREGIYNLPGNLEDKAVFIGPGVEEDRSKAQYICPYLYAILPPGHDEPIPVLAVYRPQVFEQVDLKDDRKAGWVAVRKLGRYELLRVVGVGGMGEVWEARDPFGQTVAIKTLLPGLSASERQIRRFQREAEAMAKLSHRAICRILEVGTIDDIHYIVMEYVDGANLSDILDCPKTTGNPLSDYGKDPIPLEPLIDASIERQLKRPAGLTAGEVASENPAPRTCRVLPLKQTLHIILNLCSALQYAHSHQIIHRDIKPSNIMVRRDGQALLTDFGLAKIASERDEDSLSLTGQIIGTVEFMSPEQALSSKDITEAADVYSLGAVLYLMTTGHRHFNSSGNILSDAHALQTHQVIAPRKFNKAMDRDLEAIILKALRSSPSERYQDIASFRADLDRYRKGQPVLARDGNVLLNTRKAFRRYRTTVATLGAVAVVAVAGLISFTLYQENINRTLTKTLLERDAALEESRRIQAALDEKSREALANLQMFLDQKRETEDLQSLSLSIRTALSEQILANAQAAAARGSLVEAQQLAMKATLQTPNLPSAWAALGEYYAEMRRFEPAVEALSRATQLDPSNAELRAKFESARRNLEQVGTLIGDYEKLIALGSPVSRDMHINAADTYASRGDWKRAAEAYGAACLPPHPFDANLWVRRLQAVLKAEDPPIETRDDLVRIENNQILSINLSRLNLNHIPPLGAVNIAELNLSDNPLHDLTPLAGATIDKLILRNTRVQNLEPLQQVSVKTLDLTGSMVRDIKPLRSLVIQHLILDRTPVTDLFPATFLPLHTLSLSGTQISDLSSLRGLRARHLILSQTPVQDISPLKNIPLEHLDLSRTQVSNLSALIGNSVKTLILDQSRVIDLQPLFYNVVTHLSLAGTAVRDLAPIRNLKLEMLNIRGTQVRDLSPLQSMPLRMLDLRDTPVTDLSPLKACPLESIALSPQVSQGWDVLRTKRSLTKIITDREFSPVEFWSQFPIR